MMQMTDVVKNLLIINVVLFFGTMIILGDPEGEVFMFLVNNPDSANFMDWSKHILSLFYPSSEYFRPFQLVTHMFMHADFGHVFFNMLMLFFFGPQLEYFFGPKKFLFFFFSTGFGASILHMIATWFEINYLGSSIYVENIPMLGASGAIYGVMAAFAFLFPNQEMSLLFLPIKFKAVYMIMVLLAISLFSGFQGYGTGVAHFAHLGGAFLGFFIANYWQKNGNLMR